MVVYSNETCSIRGCASAAVLGSHYCKRHRWSLARLLSFFSARGGVGQSPIGTRCTSCGEFFSAGNLPTKVWTSVCPKCGGQTVHSNKGKIEAAAPTEKSAYVNLLPGDTVPKSGEWKCNICGEGGFIDCALQGILENDKDYRGLKGHVAVKLYKAWMKESIKSRELRKSLDFLKDSQLDGRETIRFFTEGEKFTECQNCGPATGWTLLELTYEIVRKYRGAEYQPEDPQLRVYGSELRNLRDSIRKNNNKTKCYICGNTSTINFPVIEQWILSNRVREVEMKKDLGVKGMLFAPNVARDGAICKHCKGVMCPRCAEAKLGNTLIDISKCPLCGNMVYGIDHITD